MISVVIPLHNEEESLNELHRQLKSVLEDIGQDYEILFVDDGSRDGSWNVVEAIAAEDPAVRAIRFRRNFGKARALSEGFSRVRGDYVFTLDADLQDDPAEIPRFLAKLETDRLDVVSGWKRKRYDPWHKVGPSRIFNAMVSSMTGCKLHDHNCGYKLYRRPVVNAVELYGELHRFVPVLAAARGFEVGEIEVNHRPRTFGRSKYGWNRMFKGFMDLLAVSARTRFGRRPMHLIGGTGFLLAWLGAIGVAVGAVLALLGSWAVAALILVLSWTGLVGGLVLIAIGLMMEWQVADSPVRKFDLTDIDAQIRDDERAV
jgi:glycosyltransferase involved in cell wall biosynthesis